MGDTAARSSTVSLCCAPKPGPHSLLAVANTQASAVEAGNELVNRLARASPRSYHANVPSLELVVQVAKVRGLPRYQMCQHQRAGDAPRCSESDPEVDAALG